MPSAELKRIDEFAYREATPVQPTDKTPVLCVHGFPQSSYMWRHLLPALADAGHRALALDLPGYGDSPPDPPGTWERQMEAVDRFRRAADLDRLALVVHDWGGLIGLRWACEHPAAIAALVISNTGFFPDAEWHEVGRTMRTQGQGEALIDSVSRDGLAALFGRLGHGIDDAAIDEYFKCFATKEGRRGMLDLFRSGDLEKLEPYEGKLAALGVPALILWGELDEYLPDSAAERQAREIPHAKLVRLTTIGHFLFEDAPDRCAEEVIPFLSDVAA